MQFNRFLGILNCKLQHDNIDHDWTIYFYKVFNKIRMLDNSLSILDIVYKRHMFQRNRFSVCRKELIVIVGFSGTYKNVICGLVNISLINEICRKMVENISESASENCQYFI